MPGVSSFGVSESCAVVLTGGIINVEERHKVDKATYIQLLLRMLHSCSEVWNQEKLVSGIDRTKRIQKEEFAVPNFVSTVVRCGPWGSPEAGN